MAKFRYFGTPSATQPYLCAFRTQQHTRLWAAIFTTVQSTLFPHHLYITEYFCVFSQPSDSVLALSCVSSVFSPPPQLHAASDYFSPIVSSCEHKPLLPGPLTTLAGHYKRFVALEMTKGGFLLYILSHSVLVVDFQVVPFNPSSFFFFFALISWFYFSIF